MFAEVTNPKRTISSSATFGKEPFPYYAGFSPEFVRDVFKWADVGSAGLVLDPWAGAGTTAFVARTLGLSSVSVDLNPAPLVVAAARLASDRDKIRALTRLTRCRRQLLSRDITLPPDGFVRWFKVPAARTLHKIAQVSRQGASDVFQKPMNSLLFVALFRTVRKLLSKIKGSNPTWLKSRIPGNQRLNPSGPRIVDSVLDELKAIDVDLSHASVPCSSRAQKHIWHMGDSCILPVPTSSVDIIVSSPPYGTRLDYVIATLPELIALGYADDEVYRLRQQMLGTPVVSGGKASHSKILDLPTYCQSLLESIRIHPSKSSGSYYYKFFCSYFVGLADSVAELRRVIRPRGYCCLVVQGSYYKELYIDLAEIVMSMGQNLGWNRFSRQDFRVSGTLAEINKSSKNYRKTSECLESVIVLTK